MNAIYLSFSKTQGTESGRATGFLPIYLSLHPDHCILTRIAEYCGRQSVRLVGHISCRKTSDKWNTGKVYSRACSAYLLHKRPGGGSEIHSSSLQMIPN